jgi:hypothetical protein
MSLKLRSKNDWGRLALKSELHFGFNEKLNSGDSEIQTYGCRANNPDICRNYMLEGVCAFVCDDLICRQPSRSWKRQYAKLKETENERI